MDTLELFGTWKEIISKCENNTYKEPDVIRMVYSRPKRSSMAV